MAVFNRMVDMKCTACLEASVTFLGKTIDERQVFCTYFSQYLSKLSGNEYPDQRTPSLDGILDRVSQRSSIEIARDNIFAAH